EADGIDELLGGCATECAGFGGERGDEDYAAREHFELHRNGHVRVRCGEHPAVTDGSLPVIEHRAVVELRALFAEEVRERMGIGDHAEALPFGGAQEGRAPRHACWSGQPAVPVAAFERSEEHTSEL